MDELYDVHERIDILFLEEGKEQFAIFRTKAGKWVLTYPDNPEEQFA